MTQVENIELGNPSNSLLSKFGPSSLSQKGFKEVFFDSPYGQIQVIIQGKHEATPFVTFHDLGLNGRTQFTGFFASEEMEKIMEHFCVYHITAPGQEANTATIPQDAKYPTMLEMADIVDYAIGYFKLERVIGIGVGLGAHVIANTALYYPHRFIAIITINCICSASGWAEWANTKLIKFHLRHGIIDASVVNGLLTHNIGYDVMQTKPDLVRVYSEYFEQNINAHNFQRILDSYANRLAIDVDRDDQASSGFKCSVMNIVGDYSPHIDEAVEFNGKLNPKESTFVKLAECGGLVLDEQPDKFAESLMYFLQGMGYVCNLSVSRNALASRLHHNIMNERISSNSMRTRSQTVASVLSPDNSLSISASIPKEV